MSAHTRQIRGIPLWLLRDYLVELGGKVDENGRVQGPDWIATLTPQEPFQLGSLRVGQLQLTIEATPVVLAHLQPQLDKKLMRAGA